MMKLNIWCTTGTVGSYLKHPKQGNTQLFRREISTWTELDAILQNPRVHTDKGFQTKKNKAAKEEDNSLTKPRGEGCSCIWGNPCAIPDPCKDWHNRFEVAKKNGWKGF